MTLYVTVSLSNSFAFRLAASVCLNVSTLLLYILKMQDCDWYCPMSTHSHRQLCSAVTGLCVALHMAMQMLQQTPRAHTYDASLQEDDSNPHDCRPLHACWSALLQRMLRADHTALVLRALDTASAWAGSGSEHSGLPRLTPHEAHQLVETARTLTHKGESPQMWCGCVVMLPHGYLLIWNHAIECCVLQNTYW